MKKKLITLCTAAVAIVSGYGGINAYKTVENNNLLVENVEALSQGESGGFFIPCYQANTTCSYNATDASGRQCTVTVSNAVKAAPYK